MTPLKNKSKVGHTSSTILNSCSFQRYRLLFVKASSNFLTHPLVLYLSNSTTFENDSLPSFCILCTGSPPQKVDCACCLEKKLQQF